MIRPRVKNYFESKLILITGGSSGIGFALAAALLQHGARVLIIADREISVTQALADLRARGAHIEGYVCDIGLADNVAETCAVITREQGTPDIVINNAGFAVYRTFEQEDPGGIERLMSVNFAGAVRVTKAFLDGMIQRGSGHIVNVASIAGAIALTPCGVYSAAKHAMMAWSTCLALELARFGIGVTVVCPGRVETNFFNHETFQKRLHRKETEMTIPMETIVEATLEAIARRQSICYVPRYYRAVVWAYHALGPLARRPLHKLLRARVEDLYGDPGKR